MINWNKLCINSASKPKTLKTDFDLSTEDIGKSCNSYYKNSHHLTCEISVHVFFSLVDRAHEEKTKVTCMLRLLQGVLISVRERVGWNEH